MNLRLFHILIVFVILLTGCSTTQKKIAVTKRPPMYEHPTLEAPSETSPAKPLIKTGIAYLKKDNAERAEWNFEEAIKIDPDYGPAYYWLARARYRLDQMKTSLNLLEKAELLLKKSSLWIERIEKFRHFLMDNLGE